MERISIPKTKYGEKSVESPGMYGLADGEDDRTNRARRETFVKLLTNQTRLTREEAAEYVDHHLPELMKKFGGPRDPEDMEEDMDDLRESLLGAKKRKKETEDALNEY